MVVGVAKLAIATVAVILAPRQRILTLSIGAAAVVSAVIP